MSIKAILGYLQWKLRSVLQSFSLGKLTNHFRKVKSNLAFEQDWTKLKNII